MTRLSPDTMSRMMIATGQGQVEEKKRKEKILKDIWSKLYEIRLNILVCAFRQTCLSILIFFPAKPSRIDRTGLCMAAVLWDTHDTCCHWAALLYCQCFQSRAQRGEKGCAAFNSAQSMCIKVCAFTGDLRWEAKQALDWLGITISSGYHYTYIYKLLENCWIFGGSGLKDDGKTEIRAISAQPEHGGLRISPARHRARGGGRMRETGRHDGRDRRASPPRGAPRP